MIWFLCTLPIWEGWGGAIFAQNLVPNPSFEDTISCPIQPNGNHVPSFTCQNWYLPTNTTTWYLNGCAPHVTGINLNVPNNYPDYGWQYAHTGVAYIAMQTYYNNAKAFIQVELSDTLIAQHKYCVQFYINSINNTRSACNNMGMYFSDIPVLLPSAQDYIGLIPQVNDTNIVTDTVNWVQVTGEFIAVGGEQYITIGNFYSQANTDTVTINNTTNYVGAAYYIDDVSVVDCTGSGLGIHEKEDENGMVVSPNPNEGVFEVKSVKYKMKRVEVYNVMGEIIRMYELGIRNESTIKIDISNESSGIYFVAVETEKGVVRKKVIKSTK